MIMKKLQQTLIAVPAGYCENSKASEWAGRAPLISWRGFFTVLAADERGLDGSGCCEQHPSTALPVASPGQDRLALVRDEVSRSPFSSHCRDS